MNKLFSKLGSRIEKTPFKILFITIIIFAIAIAGAIKVNMATGSETLVKTDNNAYISNYAMEQEFGGDAIMVLLEGDQKDLLKLDNMEKMWNVEQRLKYNEGIFTFMSPASIVHQITDRQGTEIKKQIPDISNGLGELGDKLTEIGTELGSKELPDPEAVEKKLDNLMVSMDPSKFIEDMSGEQEAELKNKLLTMGNGLGEMGKRLTDIGNELGSKDIPNPKAMEEKLGELSNISSVFDELAGGQDNLAKGVTELGGGLGLSSEGLREISVQLVQMAEQKKDNPQMYQKLTMFAENIGKSSEGLSKMSENTVKLSQGNENTSQALNNIGKKLKEEVEEMKNSLSGDGISSEELKKMSSGFVIMGENLSDLSNGLFDMATEGSILPESSEILSDFKANIENEVVGMKDNLSGGISPDELKLMSDGFITMGENLSKLSNGLNTFHKKSGMMLPYFPHNQKELDSILYDDYGKLRDVFSDTVIDDNHMMLMIKLKGNLEDSTIDSIFEDVSYAIEKENFDVNYIVSGKPVLDSSLRTEMKSNMIIMVASAVVLMFIILNLVFKVRWRALSLGIIFVSVIATLGLMGHLNVSMTMVSMAVFPILIGLGIDYSIQFQNRYEEEQSVKITLTQIGKAVGLAVLATVLGFVSLFASPVPMIQDFGKMLTIGVGVSFVGSIFLLMPILDARDTVASKARDFRIKDYDKPTVLDKILGATGKVVTKLAPIILVISIGLATFGIIADTKVGIETDIETFMPQDMDALHDIHYIRDIVGSTNQMIIFMEDENLLSEENLQWMRDTVDEIKGEFSSNIVDIKFIDNLVGNFSDIEDLNFTEYMDIVKKDIPAAQRKMFINDEMDKAVILMNVEHMATEELQDFVENMNSMLKDAPMKTSITGKSVLDVEMVKGLTDGRLKMTIIGLGLVFVVLLLLYRSFFKALVAVLPVVLIVGMSGGIMNLLGLKYTPITATLGALVLGMGTEMTIMLLERYLEERNLGKEKDEAMSITIKNIGKATVASGLTTVGGFSVLRTSKFVILKDFGLMTVINISLALIATFVILPALIWILDRFIVKEKVKKEVYKELPQE
ncbi:hydrophobe/amphiphile efflux-3 (HAE3) family transporter [Tissierella sp. MB52-C2]|uniref:hydrophobe/amphiphile efflux-3 (HAE3) family transporter n=1 Tax=Tissierella sp. MB52-C2 TaxID=3070999 RepID=UPI00280B2ABA|nr:hydrophobe/amphiphile efflux-3 (HAE3) family transporter [Tissierella sp. MB52-C2]WMM26156.1 hydrophobe/amphiphile efflux-3 (HAE3) family transporter [Tissierella sp. MB52-C2]